MKFSKILKVFLLIIIIVFIGNQIISGIYKPVKTDIAVYFSTSDGFKINGHIIRDETLVTASNSGVKHFVIGDGNRVSKKGVIAKVYDNEAASVTVSKIDELNEKISDIKDILSYNDVEAANLELINGRISESLNNTVYSAAFGDYSEMNEVSEKLLFEISRKQAALGVTGGLSERLKSLENEVAKLSNSLPSPKGNIYAPVSGYFSSKPDGMESVFKTSDISKLTPEFLDNAKPAEVGEDVIGKIVSDYEWYIAAKVSINESLKYKEGDSVKLVTTLRSVPELPATVKNINISSLGDSAVMVFACNNMNGELATVRTCNMTVVTKEYSGLKIPKSALRVVDMKRGVFVQNGIQISFVPVEIVYSDEDAGYIICEKDSKDNEGLKLYDKVVVRGKNLYDGKVIS